MAERLIRVRLIHPACQEKGREEIVRGLLDSMYDYGLDDDPRCCGAYSALLDHLRPLIIQDCSED